MSDVATEADGAAPPTQLDLALQRREEEGAEDVTAAVARFGSAW